VRRASHTGAGNRPGGMLALAAALLMAAGCGDDVEQVRFRAQFDEFSDGIEPPVCLGAASLQGFVHAVGSDEPLGRISSVSARLDGNDSCQIESGILVVKGVPFGSDLVLRLQIVDSSGEVLSQGDSDPVDLSSGSDGSDGAPTYEVTLRRATATDGTVQLKFPDGTDLSLIAGGALGVNFDSLPAWSLSRLVDIPDSPAENWEQSIFLSGLELSSSCSVTVIGRDSGAVQAAQWNSTMTFTIETDLNNDWQVAEVPLTMQ